MDLSGCCCGSVTILSHYIREPFEPYWVVGGEVRNDTDIPICFVKITVAEGWQ